MEEYESKYSYIPRDFNERISFLINSTKLSPQKMDEIIERKRIMQSQLFYYNYKIILYEDPEGAKRPRFRMVNRKNYANMALGGGSFVHVFSPNAAEDHNFMHKLIDSELIQLNTFIQTPCQVCINVFFKTPSYFNKIDIILAEIGLHRHINKPDWDNIGKKYTDMFNANIWLDDNLVVDGEVHKYYSILPRVEIHLRYLNMLYNKYQYNNIIKRCEDGYQVDYFK